MAEAESKMAEHIQILLAVSADLLKRAYPFRKRLAAADLESFQLTERLAKRFVEKFPNIAEVKEKDPGFDKFMVGAQSVVDELAPLFDILCQIMEFRDHALVLIHEMSTTINSFSLDVNAVLLASYFNLMLNYAKLHLIVGLLASPAGRGKLAIAALARAYWTRHGRAPQDYEQVAAFLLDYEQPVLRLQDDLSKAKLRVADTLRPIGMQLLRLSDTSYLRDEQVLAPLPSTAGGTNAKTDEKAAYLADTLMSHLPEAKQWFVYGLLLNPDDLGPGKDGSPGAADLLVNVLNGMYVLPIYGSDVLYPHSEFDTDSKTLLRWLKRKDEVKRFQASIKESRNVAYRSAGMAHAAVRNVLRTKLEHLTSATTDSPTLLCPCMPSILTALRIAQDEISWWALHADVVPEELTRKEREVERDPRAFHPASVLALIRCSTILTMRVIDAKAKLAENAASRLMGTHKHKIEELVLNALDSAKLQPELEHKLRELPKHCDYANVVGVDLRGLRLNIVRIMCELSSPTHYAVASSNTKFLKLLREVHTVSALSRTIDEAEPDLAAATEWATLVADVGKNARVFATAIDSSPEDCLMLLRLAAKSTNAIEAVPPLLQQLSARLLRLARSLTDHFKAQRLEPHGVAAPFGLMHQLCTLCASIDRAAPLEFGEQRMLLQEWLREQIELFVDMHIAFVVFPNAAASTPQQPTVALGLLSDLSHALEVMTPYTHLDLHAMMDGVLARELGAVQTTSDMKPQLSSQSSTMAESGYENGSAVRAKGPAFDFGAAAAKRARGSVVEGDFAPPPAKLLERIQRWLEKAVEEVVHPEGPQYQPGRRAFSSGLLDAVELGALSRLVGAGGTARLDGQMLELCAVQPSALRQVLTANKERLTNLSDRFAKTHDLPTEAALADSDVALQACRAFGVTLVVRSLLHEGKRLSKTELLPHAVSSFVQGLGEQRLPDGQQAARVLPAVTELVAGFGQLGGLHVDAPLQQAVSEACGIAEDPELWSLLPIALALLCSHPEWGRSIPLINEDMLGGNLHCVAYALHALLSIAEPHMVRTKEEAQAATPLVAHQRFLEASAIVLANARVGMLEGKPPEVQARVRTHATISLLLEQVVQLAQPPLGYNDLLRYVPRSLVLAAYATIAQPVEIVADAPGDEPPVGGFGTSKLSTRESGSG